MKKTVTIVAPCYNEAGNIVELYQRISAIIADIPSYDFDIIIIDNCSTDGTFEILKDLAREDKRLKLIGNIRNFGPSRSPYYGVLQSSADATIYLASDLQDPPELIAEFIKQWEAGNLVVFAVRKGDVDTSFTGRLRRLYYHMLGQLSDIQLIANATGFGLYDKRVLEEVRKTEDPNPYFRGLISELGFPIKTIEFAQQTRKAGISKHNFYSLYDVAMHGFVSHTKIPLRLATFFGFAIGIFSFFASILIFILKLVFWNNFAAGIAPILIIIFFLFGATMIFIGILGEYIASIHQYVQKRPTVVERERINFD